MPLLFVLTLLTTPPEKYSLRSACELWAGAQCHASACLPDGTVRCDSARKRCMGYSRNMPIPDERASRLAQCARAMLVADCPSPNPAECQGVEAP